MKKKKMLKGFTLVELLATIVVISIVFGIGYSIVGNIINNTKDKTSLISQASIKESANLYSKENIGGITWKKLSDEDNYYTCVQVSELVNTGYLKEKQASDYLDKYVYLVKNPDNVILKETIDTDGSLCFGNVSSNRVEVPTAEDICKKDVVYKGIPQEIAEVPVNLSDKIEFVDGIERTKAGIYNVKIKLKNSDAVWDRKSNTKDVVTINCRIKKAIPVVKFVSSGTNTDGSEGEIGKTITAEIISETVSGTLSVKSSNTGHVTAKVVGDNKITAGVNKKISIKVLASRNITTQVTITFTPDDDDRKNYEETSVIYTVGKIGVQKVSSLDLVSKYCKNPIYNGREQVLVNMPKESDGFTFLNYVGTEKATITARLKYGYEWEGVDKGKEKDDIVFECGVKKIHTITYNGNGATSGSMNSQQCIEGETCVLNNNAFSKTGHFFSKWATNNPNGAGDYNNGESIILTSDVTLYAIWIANTYSITYDANGGTGAPDRQTYTYADTGTINLSSTVPTRIGYTFAGWAWNGNTYSAGQSWDRNNADNYTLVAIWNVNLCHITYHANGGSYSTPHGSEFTKHDDYIYKNGALLVQSYAYGENGGYISQNGLLNYNNEEALNLHRTGYQVISTNEWYRAGHKAERKYDQKWQYKISTICPDIETKSQSVVMKVNWIKKSTSGENSPEEEETSCSWSICTGIVSSGAYCIDGCGGSTNRCFCRYKCCV